MLKNGRSMTPRARWYLAICGTRHLLVAVFAILAPASFESPSFYPIINAAPLEVWGVAFAGAGIVCIAGAITKHSTVARLGLMWSATSTAMVAVGLFLAYFTGDLSSPTGPIIWAAVAFKDFTVCADPLRSPFEDWADELVTDSEAEDAAAAAEETA